MTGDQKRHIDRQRSASDVRVWDSGGHSAVEPPGSIPNPEVKRFSADGSVAIGHVRVGRRQFKINRPVRRAVFFCPDRPDFPGLSLVRGRGPAAASFRAGRRAPGALADPRRRLRLTIRAGTALIAE